MARAAGGRQRQPLGREPHLAGPRARDRAPHPPVFEKSKRQDAAFERAGFAYDHTADAFTCSAGKPLCHRQKTYRDLPHLADESGMLRYRASKLDCEACPLTPRCCSDAPARKVLRSIHEGARDMARGIANAYVGSRRGRKKVEMGIVRSTGGLLRNGGIQPRPGNRRLKKVAMDQWPRWARGPPPVK